MKHFFFIFSFLFALTALGAEVDTPAIKKIKCKVIISKLAFEAKKCSFIDMWFSDGRPFHVFQGGQ